MEVVGLDVYLFKIQKWCCKDNHIADNMAQNFCKCAFHNESFVFRKSKFGLSFVYVLITCDQYKLKVHCIDCTVVLQH